MRIAAHYSHLNGLEYLLVHQPGIWEEIQEIIAAADGAACKTKVSKEKTMKGKFGLFLLKSIKGRGRGHDKKRLLGHALT